MLTFKGSTPGDAGEFLANHWQKQPVFLPGAAEPGSLPAISPDELAWLATLDDVESRLVFTEHQDGAAFYRMETGPFTDDALRALPESNWTLLVQDVEKHLPELREYLGLVPFIPDWRIDDLMISVAAPGGSVGPHVDNYDVFLVQASGRRHWKWTSANVPVCRKQSRELRLVEDFVGDGEAVSAPGDVLYLNPGVAHFGVAEDLCVTCSIGMRAPQVSELAGCSVEGDDAFYTDKDLDLSEARPGYISGSAVHRAAQLLADYGFASVDPELALGRYATSPKEWLQPESDDSRTALRGPLEVHGMARLAWTNTHVFANGRSFALSDSIADDLELICRSRRLDERTLGRWRDNPDALALLKSLRNAGIFNAENTGEDELTAPDM